MCYRECPGCGACLDPGEVCFDCTKDREEVGKDADPEDTDP